jgi:hypothetical protein
LIADVEIEFSAPAVVVLGLDGNAIIDSHRTDRKIETDAKTHVRIDVAASKIVSVFVDEADIIKECPRTFSTTGKVYSTVNRARVLPADGFIIRVLGSDIAIFEAAQIIRAAQEKAVENRDAITASPSIDHSSFSVQREDRIPWKQKVF